MITRDFDLWITQGHTKRLVFNANQYDQGETWRFRILGADGNPIVPTTAAIIGQKKDGHAILVQGTVSDGKVVITETEQMTACAGLTEFELLLNGETHGTANFTVQVEKRPGDDADLSDSDLSLIQDAVDAAEVIVEVIGDGDPSEVIGEHVDAWLDAHPEATTTVQDGAITAPKINQSLWDKLLVSEEASGNPASFDDGADDVPVSSLKVALEPIQTGSGDPSPTNIRPITGHTSVTMERTGKNLLDIYNTVATQRVTFAGEPNDFTLAVTGEYCYYQIEIPCKANQPVTVHFDGTSTGDNRRVYVSHPNAYTNSYKIFGLTGTLTNNTYTFTPTEDAFRMTFYVTATDTTGDMHIKNLQAEYGSEATEYEPFVSNSYPYSLGQTVYGGTVDLATGVLTVDKVIVDIGSMDWATFSTPANHIFRASYPTPAPKVPASSIVPVNAISSCYTVMAYSPITENDNGKFAIGNKRVVIINHDYSDVAAFTTAMAGQTICYELATPQIYQLTPTQVKTLLGYNNISSTGTVDVIYHADTKLYVDKMTAVDNNIIAPTEADFVATRNYTVNDLVIVNDTLYKATANIASGSAITPNSNVTQTTLSALIKALS